MSISGATGVIGSRIIELFTTFTNQNNEHIKNKKNIVVVGYGWAGKSFYDNIDKKKYNVQIVNKNNYMLNTTKLKKSLYSHDDKLIVPLQNVYRNDIILGSVENIDLTNKKVETNSLQNVRDTLYYDYLVLAVGSEVNDFGIEGVKEHCNFLKDEIDLIKLQKRYYPNESQIIRMEQKVGILGAGPAGIELAFEISNIKKKEVYIIEAMDKILPMFSEEAANIVKKELEDANIKLYLSNKVSKITKEKIHTNQKTYDFDVAIWNCGIKPNKLISLVTNDNRINAYDNFKVHNLKGELNLDQSQVYAIGDIVASKSHGPPTAQNAVQQGKYLAEYFNNNLKGEPYKFNELGKVIYTKNYIVLDSKYGVYKIPKMFSNVVELFMG